MGGSIRLESEPGVGTVFEIVVPYQAADAAEAGEAMSAVDLGAVLPPMRILLAEDNAVNQKVASRILEKNGHSICIASNGHAAVKASGREAFDLILMDVQMPEMDGLQATAAIRASERGSYPSRTNRRDDGSCDERRSRTLPRRRNGWLRAKTSSAQRTVPGKGGSHYAREGFSKWSRWRAWRQHAAASLTPAIMLDGLAAEAQSLLTRNEPAGVFAVGDVRSGSHEARGGRSGRGVDGGPVCASGAGGVRDPKSGEA
jgi:CheY-like chemotaxis protein